MAVGKLADFLILDRDIMKVGAKEVIGAKIKLAMLGDEMVCRLP